MSIGLVVLLTFAAFAGGYVLATWVARRDHREIAENVKLYLAAYGQNGERERAEITAAAAATRGAADQMVQLASRFGVIEARQLAREAKEKASADKVKPRKVSNRMNPGWGV